MIGILTGGAFGMAVYIGGTMHMSLEDSFDMVCACMVLISCLNFWFVREPKIKIPKTNLNPVADSDI